MVFSSNAGPRRNIGPLDSDRYPDNLTEPNTLAHYRYSLSICPPALCRHVMVFFPYRGPSFPASPSDDIFDSSHPQDEIMGFIHSICSVSATISSEQITQFVDHLTQNHTATLLIGDFNRFTFRVKIDMHTEYYSISFILDRPGYELDSLSTQLNEPHALADFWKKHIDEDNPGLLSSKLSDHGILHEAVWDALDKRYSLDLLSIQYGRMLGDFRGVTFFAKPPTNLDNNDHTKTIPTSINPPPSRWDTFEFFSQYKKFFLMCMGFQEDGSIIDPDDNAIRIEPNVVLCELLDGLAILGSDLGRPPAFQLPGRLPEDSGRPPRPITYFLIYGGHSYHQLGRAIHRQHTAAELRLAALIDRQTIFQLGHEIRKLGDDLSTFIELASVTPGESSLTDSDVDGIVKQYNELGTKCHGGFFYRISMTEYYYNALNERLTEVRCRSIEGWQTYKDFVDRNLGQVYRSTITIGDRYKLMAARIDRLVTLHGMRRQRLIPLSQVGQYVV